MIWRPTTTTTTTTTKTTTTAARRPAHGPRSRREPSPWRVIGITVAPRGCASAAPTAVPPQGDDAPQPPPRNSSRCSSSSATTTTTTHSRNNVSDVTSKASTASQSSTLSQEESPDRSSTPTSQLPPHNNFNNPSRQTKRSPTALSAASTAVPSPSTPATASPASVAAAHRRAPSIAKRISTLFKSGSKTAANHQQHSAAQYQITQQFSESELAWAQFYEAASAASLWTEHATKAYALAAAMDGGVGVRPPKPVWSYFATPGGWVPVPVVPYVDRQTHASEQSRVIQAASRP